MSNVYKINSTGDSEKEHQLLSFLHQNESTSQRKIASGTGLSLATVNILLKRMIKRGLIKIEQLNRRNLRYILTPKGLTEKSRFTYNYVIYSYRLINRLITIVHNCIAEEQSKAGLREVVLLGQDDYIHELLAQALAREEIPYQFCAQVEDLPAVLDQILILTWDRGMENELQGFPCKVVNVMLYL